MNMASLIDKLLMEIKNKRLRLFIISIGFVLCILFVLFVFVRPVLARRQCQKELDRGVGGYTASIEKVVGYSRQANEVVKYYQELADRKFSDCLHRWGE
jgi:hypothetical protein